MVSFQLKDSEVKYLEFTIKDADGNYFDLTGSTIRFQVMKYGESTLRLNGACEITDATNGKCRYLYSGNLPVGSYKAELEISKGGLKYISPNITLEVISDLP